MMIEAIYRDGHKERFIANDNSLLAAVVELAKSLHKESKVKFVRIVGNDRNH